MKKNLLFIMSLLIVMVLTTVNVSAAEYTLKVEDGYISSIGGVSQPTTLTTSSIEEGTEVRIDAIVKSGYYFDHWSSDSNFTFDGSIKKNFTFTMPSKNIKITANEISTSSYKTIETKDVLSLKDDLSNIDELISFDITYYAPSVGDINSTNKGKFKLPDTFTFETERYFDEEGNEVTKIEHGKNYLAAIIFKSKDLEQFDGTNNTYYIIKSTGSDVTDVETGFLPTNYVYASAGTDYNSNEEEFSLVIDTPGLANRYIACLVKFEGKYNYDVTFDSNGVGTAPESQIVVEDKLATKPTDLTADGYTFGGWYLDKDCTKAYDFSSKVNSNITLYAKWTKNTNPPTYDGVITWILTGMASLIIVGGLLVIRRKISCK